MGHLACTSHRRHHPGHPRALTTPPEERRRRLPSEAIYPAREVAATLNLPVIGQLPADERSVAVLTGNLPALPRRRLLPLLRTAGEIAAALAAGLPEEPQAAGPGPGTTRTREVAEVSGDPIR